MVNIIKTTVSDYLPAFFEKHKRKNLFWFSIFILASLVLVAPLFGDHLYAGLFSDLLIHARLVQSAYQALFREFSFPLFYNNDIGLALEPIFRYYSVTTYVISSFFVLIGFSAYNSLLLGTALLYSLGAFGIFLTARFFRCDCFSSFLGGLTYLYAPYFLADVYARSAFTEVSLIGVLPLVFYAVVRLLSSNGRRWGIRTALFTALLLLSHKIFFPWFFCLAVLFLIANSSVFTIKKLLFKRLFPLIFWIGIGMLLSSPYWLAAYLNLPQLKISAKGIEFNFLYLSEWKMLLSPFFYVYPGCPTPNLATQYGLPVMLGFMLIFFSKNRLKLKISLFITGMFVFMLETNTGHILTRFPRLFWSLQFPYRLLIFSVLFGSISAALALCSLSRWRMIQRLKLGFFILILIYLAIYYKIPAKTSLSSRIAEEDKIALFYDDYLEKPSLENRCYEKFFSDLWIGQDAVMRLKREANDELSFSVSGFVADQIDKSKPLFVDITINSQPWRRVNLTRPNMKIEALLPAVSTVVYQEIKFHFSHYFIPKEVAPPSPDYRQLVIRNYKLNIWKKRDVTVDESRMSARGNRVRFKNLEMKRDRDYIVPAMYSHHLKADPDFISILPHSEGMILKTSQDGSFDITITRREFPYIRKKLLEMIRNFLSPWGRGEVRGNEREEVTPSSYPSPLTGERN